MHRFFIVVIFIAVMVAMTFVIKAAAAAGWIPLLLVIAGIVWVGWLLEQRQRRLAGAPLYSWQDAKLELYTDRWFYAGWGTVIAVAFVWHYGFTG